MVYWPACFEHLTAAEEQCATLSVWHIRAFITGAQTGILHLGLDPAPSAKLLGEFMAYLRQKYGDAPNEFEAIARESTSHKASATILIRDWFDFWSQFPLPDHASVTEDRIPKSFDLKPNLSAIERRPLLYLPQEDITHLRALLEGVEFIVERFGSGAKMEPDLKGFQIWLRENRPGNYHCPWHMQLTSWCAGDGTRAMKVFFDGLRDYTASSGQAVP